MHPLHFILFSWSFQKFQMHEVIDRKALKMMQLKFFFLNNLSGDKIRNFLSSSGSEHNIFLPLILTWMWTFFCANIHPAAIQRMHSAACFPKRAQPDDHSQVDVKKGIFCRSFEFETRFQSYARITPEDYNGKAKLETNSISGRWKCLAPTLLFIH